MHAHAHAHAHALTGCNTGHAMNKDPATGLPWLKGGSSRVKASYEERSRLVPSFGAVPPPVAPQTPATAHAARAGSASPQTACGCAAAAASRAASYMAVRPRATCG